MYGRRVHPSKWRSSVVCSFAKVSGRKQTTRGECGSIAKVSKQCSGYHQLYYYWLHLLHLCHYYHTQITQKKKVKKTAATAITIPFCSAWTAINPNIAVAHRMYADPSADSISKSHHINNGVSAKSIAFSPLLHCMQNGRLPPIWMQSTYLRWLKLGGGARGRGGGARQA